MYEDNLEYAKGRLELTLVRVKEEPFFVHTVKNIGKTMVAEGVFFYKEGEISVVKMSDLNLEPVPLGYINYGPSAYFLLRKPARKWKQGLNTGNMGFVGAQGFRDFPPREMRETVLGIYPTFKDSLNLIKTHVKVAFCREFAITENKHILYRERNVGKVDKLVSLEPRYNYLSEYLEEMINVGA